MSRRNGAPGDCAAEFPRTLARWIDTDGALLRSLITLRRLGVEGDAAVGTVLAVRRVQELRLSWELWVCKFWLAHVRGQDPHCRITIAIDHVPTVRGEENSEADIATKNLLDLAPLTPGALGAISDTALRGTRLDRLQRQTGWVVVNPTAAERSQDRGPHRKGALPPHRRLRGPPSGA
jgi:hypothetical protein